MNNEEYWKKRILDDEEENNQDSIEEYERQIKILQDAKMEIRKTIKLYLSQLKKNNSLENIQEVNKLLEEDELEEFHWDYKKYVEKAKEYASYVNRNSKELVLLDRALKNASLKYRISKKEAFVSEIRMKIVEVGLKREESLRKHLEKVVEKTRKKDNQPMLPRKEQKLIEYKEPLKMEEIKEKVVEEEIEKVVKERIKKSIEKAVKEKEIEKAVKKVVEEVKSNIEIPNKLVNVNISNVNVGVGDSLEQVVNQKWAGDKTFSERIWKDVDRLRNTLENKLPNSITLGDPNLLIKHLEKEFNTSKSNAKRLVLTEGARVHNKTRLQNYKDMEVEEVEILATLDLRTSSICRGKDRQKVKLEKAEIGKELPPFHPYCRSVFIPVLSQELQDIVNKNRDGEATRVERDIETGKSVIGKDKDYKDYEERIGKEKLEVLRKKHKNRNSDKKQYEKYKKVLGKENMPKTFDLFQDMKYNNLKEYTNFKNRYRVLTKEEFHKLKSGAQQKHLPGTNNYSNVVRKAFDKATNRIDDFALKSYFGEETIDFKKYIEDVGLDGKMNTSEYVEKLKESSIEYSKKIEEVILRKMASGKVHYSNGKYTEILNLENENIKGWVYDKENKKWIKTNYVKIHYSKDGFHVVPHNNIEKE